MQTNELIMHMFLKLKDTYHIKTNRVISNQVGIKARVYSLVMFSAKNCLTVCKF